MPLHLGEPRDHHPQDATFIEGVFKGSTRIFIIKIHQKRDSPRNSAKTNWEFLRLDSIESCHNLLSLSTNIEKGDGQVLQWKLSYFGASEISGDRRSRADANVSAWWRS